MKDKETVNVPVWAGYPTCRAIVGEGATHTSFVPDAPPLPLGA